MNTKDQMKTKPNYYFEVPGDSSAVLLIDDQWIKRSTSEKNRSNGGKLHFFCNHMIHNQYVTRQHPNKNHFSAEIPTKVRVTNNIKSAFQPAPLAPFYT